jgi:hypothetical protein
MVIINNKTNNHFSSQTIEHKKNHDIGNPDPVLGQAQNCGRVIAVNVNLHK